MISSVVFKDKWEARPGEILNILSELIDEWDPPMELMPSNALKSRIAFLVDVEQVLSERSEFDSHTNKVVVGKHCWIIYRSKWSVNVSAFENDVGGLKSVPIIDAFLAYDCKRTIKTYLLVVMNTLYCESMSHNLIPPFIMRKS